MKLYDLVQHVALSASCPRASGISFSKHELSDKGTGMGHFHPLYKAPEARSRVAAPQLSLPDAAVRQQYLHSIENEIQVFFSCCILILWIKLYRKACALETLLSGCNPGPQKLLYFGPSTTPRGEHLGAPSATERCLRLLVSISMHVLSVVLFLRRFPCSCSWVYRLVGFVDMGILYANFHTLFK